MEISFKEAFTFMFKDEKFKSKYIIGSLFCLLFVISMGLYLDKAGEFFSFMSSDFYSQLNSTSQSSEVPVEFLTFYAGMMLCSLFMFIGSFVMLFSIGYCIEYAKQKISTDYDELPEWKGNYGKMFLNGLKMYGGVLLFTFSFGILLEIIMLILFVILGVITAILIALFSSASEAAIGILIIIMAIIAFVILLLLMFGFSMFYNIAHASFLVDTNPLSFFNFKRMGAISKNNLSNMFAITLTMIVCCIVFNIMLFLGVIYSFTTIYSILIMIFMFYFLLVFYNLLAQYTKIGMKKYLTRVEAEKQQQQG